LSKRSELYEWVKAQHKGQLIRKTKLPYFEHLIFVAELAGPAAPLTYEIGLCHDLIEKTETDLFMLASALRSFGYPVDDTAHITTTVAQLTRAHHPDLSNRNRKALEAERLINSSADVQTVKYADLLYNAEWMIDHQPKKAQKYLGRKIRLIAAMTKGDAELRKYVLAKLF
jgi:hypothetical protein